MRVVQISLSMCFCPYTVAKLKLSMITDYNFIAYSAINITYDVSKCCSKQCTINGTDDELDSYRK